MKMTSLFTHPQAILGVSDFILSDEYNRIYTEQNYKRNTFVFAPISHEPELKDLRLFLCTQKGLFLWNIVHKSV